MPERKKEKKKEKDHFQESTSSRFFIIRVLLFLVRHKRPVVASQPVNHSLVYLTLPLLPELCATGTGTGTTIATALHCSLADLRLWL